MENSEDNFINWLTCQIDLIISGVKRRDHKCWASSSFVHRGALSVGGGLRVPLKPTHATKAFHGIELDRRKKTEWLFYRALTEYIFCSENVGVERNILHYN